MLPSAHAPTCPMFEKAHAATLGAFTSPLNQPSELPLDSARHTWNRRGLTLIHPIAAKPERNFAALRKTEEPSQNQGPPLGKRRPRHSLVLLFTSLFPAALARQSFFHTLFLTGFQVEGVPLHFLDDVLLLHFALKAPQCIFEGLTFLQSDFSHLAKHPQTGPVWTR